VERVAYFAHTCDLSGPNNSLIHLLRALDRDRFEPVVYFPCGGMALDLLRGVGERCCVVPWHLIEPSRGLRHCATYVGDLFGGTLAVRRALRRDGVRLVHVNTSVTPYPGLAARSLGLPTVWHVREILRRTTMHDWYLAAVTALASRIVTVSEAVRRQLLARTRGRSEKTRVIANGIDLDWFDSMARSALDRTSLGLPVERKLIAVPASLLPRHKGHEVLLEATSLLVRDFGLHDFCVVLIGDEPDQGDRPFTRSLRDYCREHDLQEHVLFLGFRRDVPALLARSDIVCMPSVCDDACPRGVLEGMAAGKPVVGSDVGGIPEMIAHDRTGLLVPRGRADALAGALAELIRDGSKAERFGREGRARVERELTSQMHARRIEALYDEVLGAA